MPCLFRKCPAKPEEIVCRLYVICLRKNYGYFVNQISIENRVYIKSKIVEKLADIVISRD